MTVATGLARACAAIYGYRVRLPIVGPDRWVLATVLGCAIALPGCESRRLDMGNIKAAIAEDVAAETGVAVSSVDCPDKIPLRAGMDFECTVHLASGEQRQVAVQQGSGVVRWQPADGAGAAADSPSGPPAELRIDKKND